MHFSSKDEIAAFFTTHPQTTRIEMQLAEGIYQLPSLPENLTHLRISFGPDLRKLSLPDGLLQLTMEHCWTLASLPKLPTSLTHLIVSDSPALMHLPQMPEGSRFLSLQNCPMLMWLPGLPSTMTHITAQDCPALLPPKTLPAGLERLQFVNCPAVAAGRLRVGGLVVEIR